MGRWLLGSVRKRRKMTGKIILTAGLCVAIFSLSGCAGGAREAAAMPTPILCKTILDMSPLYVRYNEYLDELKNRKNDCGKYVGETRNVRIR